MKRGGAKSKLIVISMAIVIVWFFLFGIRLVGYFSAINERGLRETVCGAQGCNNIVFILDILWTFSFFIVIPLIIPLALVNFWSSKEKSS